MYILFFLSNCTHDSSPWGRTIIGRLGKLDGFVMRIFTGFLSRWRGLTDKFFECPGLGIVRQYKNDGEEEDNLPDHSY
jgi:hypothetical protein